MKYYTLSIILNKRPISVKRVFNSRNSAIEKAFKIFRKFGKNTQVDRIIEKDDKHNLEYICDEYTRFFISRKVIAN